MTEPDKKIIDIKELSKEEISNLSQDEIKEITADRMLKAHEELNISPMKSKFTESQINTLLSNGERGDAELYKALFKDRYLYDHIAQSWFYWNDHYWREDLVEQHFAAIEELVEVYDLEKQRLIWAAATAKKSGKSEDSEKHQKKIKLLRQRIESLNSSLYSRRVIKTAKAGINSLGFPGDAWDKKSMILITKNGCIDLKTGQIVDGNPKDYIRTCCPVDIDISADCKEWKNYLHVIFDGQTDVIKYVQKLLGYSLTGTGQEHIFPIFYGIHGRNGKSTMFEVLKQVLGDQAHKAPNDFLIKKRAQKASGDADTSLMALQGKKLVWCSEVDKGDFLDLPKVKGLTGGDSITARGLFARKTVTFDPTFLTIMLTNRLAHVDASDEAFWQRAIVIPFTLSFVRNPIKDYDRPRDKHLKEKLLKEKSGILKWLIQGCLLYQKEGLETVPGVIATATAEYREGEDLIRSFLQEYYTACEDSNVDRTEMYELYKFWCGESTIKHLGKGNFFKEISRRFGKPKRSGSIYSIEGLLKKSIPCEEI